MNNLTAPSGPRACASRQLHEAMKRMTLQIRTLLGRPLPDLELSWIQFQVLAVLAAKPRRITYISICTGYDNSATRWLLERLVAKGLVDCVDDQRQGERWELSTMGIELIRDFDEIGKLRIEEAATFLTLEELQATVYWMERLADSMEQRSLSDALTDLSTSAAPSGVAPVHDHSIERT